MKFRTKILLAIWGVVLGLLIVTYIVINYWMRVQVVSRFTEDLKSNFTAVRKLEGLRNGEIVRSSQIVAESPRLKAVVEIGDRNTANQLCQELNRNLRSDLFVLTNAHGAVFVAIADSQVTPLPLSGISSIPRALERDPAAGIFATSLEAFRCASVPLIIGPDLVGTLTLGFKITRDDIRSIQSMTNSEIALVTGGLVVASTLNTVQMSELQIQLRGEGTSMPPFSPGDSAKVFTLVTRSNRFAGVWCSLDPGAPLGKSAAGFLLLKPIESEVQAILHPVIRSFIVLSIIVLILTAAIGFFISQGITRPIAALVNGTAEVSRGNYDYRIIVRTGGELGYLAQKFAEMSRSLKEKITQLGERNAELEAALQQLRETQEELVKSERLAATGRLTAQLSHEINNPVHNIQSCLQTVLKRTKPDSPDRELLDAAFEEVERLAKLTRQMLDVYRTSLTPTEREPICLNDVIREIVTASTPMLENLGIAIELSLDPSLPDILASRDKLKQVFLNLITNARDAMMHGGAIRIGTHAMQNEVVVTVSDTGAGIPPENINRIFDAFFTTKSSVSGVGLGLSVTYGIIKQYDGTISVKSELGRGTTFTITLPKHQ